MPQVCGWCYAHFFQRAVTVCIMWHKHKLQYIKKTFCKCFFHGWKWHSFESWGTLINWVQNIKSTQSFDLTKQLRVHLLAFSGAHITFISRWRWLISSHESSVAVVHSISWTSCQCWLTSWIWKFILDFGNGSLTKQSQLKVHFFKCVMM